MKDRVTRTYRKKPKHSLRTAMIFMVLFTTCVVSASAVILTVFGKENRELSRRIDNYSQEVDYLEKENDDSLQKYIHKNP